MHPRWKEESETLRASYEFNSFELAMQFMQEAAKVISIIDHHPQWCNVYNKVWVRLTTHDAGNTLSSKDYELAEALDSVFEHVQH